jgi:DNA-binding MarR family transcriptional regulator
MPDITDWNPAHCNCLALRQAARHLTQYYDQQLAAVGLRSTQYSILSRLDRVGPLGINALAALMVMDRTTLGRNILPLQRDGLLESRPSASDRRSKELALTASGRELLRRARKQWNAAQEGFESAFGAQQAATLRGMLGSVVGTELAA